MRIYIASDHAGFELKEALKKTFSDWDWKDLGTETQDRVDYPDFAVRLAEEMKDHPDQKGVLICGSGQGMAIMANRYPYIRAALCYSEEVVRLARSHNDANVLCLGSRFCNEEQASEWLKTFVETEFEGGRHAVRVEKLGDQAT